MKTLLAWAALLLLLSAAPCAAQSSPAPKTNPAVAPTEPEIMMPQVVLQIEDLSVEKVQAQLPPQEELLPPERSIPLLKEGELVIGEPSLPAAAVNQESSPAAQRDRTLASEVNLGAGMQNRIVGSVSLKTLGVDPRFALQFRHETLDGFSGQPAGAGFSLRNDGLDGSLKFMLGSVNTELGGTFAEAETGLQGLSPFVARLARTLSGSAVFTGTPVDWLTLSAGASGSTDSLTLQAAPLAGSPPAQLSGLRVSPSLSAQARFGPVKLGIGTGYTFRADPDALGSPTGTLHRFTADATVGADLPASLLIDGSFGWYWSSAGLSVFPFSLSLTGTPVSFLTLSVDGGYRVTPYDLHDTISASSLLLPNTLADDTGWFADTAFQLTLARDLAGTIGVSFARNDAMPMAAPTDPATGTNKTVQDPGTGLFVLAQAPGTILSSDIGLRWGISQAFSLSGGWTHQYLDRLFFVPSDTIRAEIIGIDPAGRFGGNLSISMAPTITGTWQIPVIHISGFWKISDTVKLQLDGDDLMAPLLPQPRWDIQPFVTPGFRVTGSLSMSL